MIKVSVWWNGTQANFIVWHSRPCHANLNYLKVTVLTERTERLLKLDDEYRENDEKSTATKLQQLKKAMEECAVNCKLKLEKFKESMLEEELELERKYLKFEENLRNNWPNEAFPLMLQNCRIRNMHSMDVQSDDVRCKEDIHCP